MTSSDGSCPTLPVRGGSVAVAVSLALSVAAADQAAAQGAQETPKVLPKVQVSAEEEPFPQTLSSPKATAPLLDTPQTVTVIPERIITEQGATTLNEALRNSPGITLNAGENAFVAGPSNINIRGFESSHNIFIDGARDHGNYARDMFNVERVEVAKGAASDNGRGGAGGYVNIVTKTPHPEAFQHATLGFGFDNDDSDERKRATIDVNQPLSDTTAFRINALWQDGGVAGRDIAQKDAWAIAPSLALGLATPTRFIASYQHFDQDDLPDWGVPGGVVPGVTPNANPVPTQRVNRANFYGLASDYDNIKSDSGLMRIEHDFSPSAQIFNQTRYAKTEREALYTVPGSLAADAETVNPSRQAALRENESVSNITNLSLRLGTGSVRHTLALGLEFSREEAETGRNFLALGTVEPTNVYNPDPFRPVTGPVDLTPAYVDEVVVKTAALYAYDTMELNEHWQITGGVRAERYDASIRTRSTQDVSVPEEIINYDTDDTTVSGKIGIVYKPAPNGSIYAAWGVSKQPPGADFLSNADGSRPGAGSAFPSLGGQNNPNAKTQESTNYEIGTKWALFDERLAATVSLFRTERDNIALASDASGIVTAYGDQTVEGIEIGISGEITENWTVFGGWVFMDSEKSHIDANFDGDPLALTPEQSGSLWTTYRLPFGLTIGGGFQYVDESYVGRPTNIDTHVDAGANGILPDYFLVNFMASYNFNDKLTVRLNVDNITDELYATSLNYSARRAVLGPPRTYLLSAELRF